MKWTIIYLIINPALFAKKKTQGEFINCIELVPWKDILKFSNLSDCFIYFTQYIFQIFLRTYLRPKIDS